MSIFTDGVAPATNVEDRASPAMNDGASGKLLPLPQQEERRKLWRFPAAFRPACVMVDGRMLLGTIRNMSRKGVMVELDTPLRPGTKVAYFWDETRLVNATVIWCDENRVGLENEKEERLYDPTYSYRSVRVPCSLEAMVWIKGDSRRVTVLNLSLGGMRIKNAEVHVGVPLTVRIGGAELYNVAVKWTKKDEAGLRFAERLNRQQLSAILASHSGTVAKREK